MKIIPWNDKTGNITLSCDSDKINISTDSNQTGAFRTQTITVTAGELTQNITIEQDNKEEYSGDYTLSDEDYLLMTYNVGGFGVIDNGDGYQATQIPLDRLDEFKTKFRDMMFHTYKTSSGTANIVDSRMPDIILVQEYCQRFIKNKWDSQYASNNVLFPEYKLEDGTGNWKYVEADTSGHSINGVLVNPSLDTIFNGRESNTIYRTSGYTTGSHFVISLVEINLHGQTVAVVSTHINPLYADDYTVPRFKQAMELQKFLGEIENVGTWSNPVWQKVAKPRYNYVIIGMDANTFAYTMMCPTDTYTTKGGTLEFNGSPVTVGNPGGKDVTQQNYGFDDLGYSCVQYASDNGTTYNKVYNTIVDQILVKGFEVISAGRNTEMIYNGETIASNMLSDHSPVFCKVKMKLYEHS